MFTQWEIARTVDIQLSRYSRMEKGICQPSYAEGVRLGQFLAVAPTVLFPVVEHAQAS